jgi:hypothetical protein
MTGLCLAKPNPYRAVDKGTPLNVTFVIEKQNKEKLEEA